MPLDLLFFGAIRDTLGRDSERVDPPSHVLTVDDLVGWLAERGAPYRDAFGDKERVRAAVEGQRAEREDSVFGAQEVALFPPMGAL
jgi:molybdopterin synthase sulfur carrier subunit